MLQIDQVKLPVGHTEKELEGKIRKILRLGKKEPVSYEIRKKSIDARKKPQLFVVYQIRVRLSPDREKSLCSGKKPVAVHLVREAVYSPKVTGEKQMKHPPVVIGAGPAGLFCAFLLTEMGFSPIVCERGREADKRKADVERFWETGILDPVSNVQFGEGGAGAFSDGKLNTGVKDQSGRIRFMLETFVRFGAPADILIDQKPHIGTDILTVVVMNMRRYLQEKGCRFCFETRMADLSVEDGRLKGIVVEKPSGGRESAGDQMPEKPFGEMAEQKPQGAVREFLETEVLVLAIGHSARDTFRRLQQLKIPMQPKNFAVGFRVEHPQRMIDEAMYGRSERGGLPAAPYKVTANLSGGRGVYSFCMCPGGYVVAAASGKEQTVVNGMSYSGRSGGNANSAIIISVTPEDFGDYGPLSGIVYQEMLEKKAWALGKGAIPQQLYGDFCADKKSSGFGAFDSEAKGKKTFANLRGLFSAEMEQAFLAGMGQFARKIPGFDRSDAILSGVESRTSSPVRILRGKNFESAVPGIYPCGEGAGYAGGITSAAVDGLKVAEAVAGAFCPN